MNTEKLTEAANRIPFFLLLLGYLASLGYDYYTFLNDPTSVLNTKKAELVAAKNSNAKVLVKVTELEKFAQSLDAKKVELRGLVAQFQTVSGALADRLDTPLFMKMIITEAKKVGLKVESLRPKGSSEKDFYLETIFTFSYRGIFGQLLVFLQRLASTTEIVRIDEIGLKINSSPSLRFVEIKGDLEIRTYTYLSAKAEAMVKQLAANSESANLATPGVAPSAGAKAGDASLLPPAAAPPPVGAKP